MWIRVRAQGVQKAGNARDEYEDAYCPRDSRVTEAVVFRVAVADGATETSYSGLWAQELASEYCRRPLRAADLARMLQKAQVRWQTALGGKPLPWYAEEKLRQGAFSTLVGLTVDASEDRASGQSGRITAKAPADDAGHTPNGIPWAAMAAGDSCLFHLSEGTIVSSFPLSEPEEFSNHPSLLSSLPSQKGALDGLVSRTSGVCRPGDMFLLATDALAHWLLTHSQRKTSAKIDAPRGKSDPKRPAAESRVRQLKNRKLSNLGSDRLPPSPVDPPSACSAAGMIVGSLGCREDFQLLVNELRSRGEMRNDDVTALGLDILETPP